MRKQKESALSNTKIAIVFFLFLVFIVGISLIIKVTIIVKAGQFDSSKRFTLSITNDKNIEIISFSPSSKNIVIFKFNNMILPKEAGRLLEIPIDGFINLSSLDLNQKISPLLLKTVFDYRNLKTNLTIIDLLRLEMFTKTVPDSFVEIKIIGENPAQTELNEIVNRLVSDNYIEKDNQTIKIINGTDTVGFGNRLARFVTNMGGNVIIVATSESPRRKSEILYFDQKTYTVKRLEKALGYETTKETKNMMSDITIIIGEDKANSAPF
jgi:hypothetical protein